MDSLRFLTALDNRGTVHPLFQQIIALYHALVDLCSSFTFVWCPGNVITGNEGPDTAARYTVDSPQVDTIAIRPDDAKVAVTTTIINGRQAKIFVVKQGVR